METCEVFAIKVQLTKGLSGQSINIIDEYYLVGESYQACVEKLVNTMQFNQQVTIKYL